MNMAIIHSYSTGQAFAIFEVEAAAFGFWARRAFFHLLIGGGVHVLPVGEGSLMVW